MMCRYLRVLSIFHLLTPVEMLSNLPLRHLCKGTNLEMPSGETALHIDFVPLAITAGPEDYCCPKIKECLLVTVCPTSE